MNIDIATIKTIGPNTKKVRPVDIPYASQNNNTTSYKNNYQRKKESENKQFDETDLINIADEICDENEKQFAANINIPCAMYSVELRNKIKPFLNKSLYAFNKINEYKKSFSDDENSRIDIKR